MIFERIEIRNLFSYRRAEIELGGACSGRNSALIAGRKGYGKTSLLNAVKLLFVGPSVDLCRAVQRGNELREKDYVLGLGEEWLGIMNRRARREGQTRCEVRIRWLEANGLVEAARARATHELGAVLIKAGEIGEGKKMLEQGGKGFLHHQRAVRTPFVSREICQRLIAFYGEQGDSDGANRWRNELSAFESRFASRE